MSLVKLPENFKSKKESNFSDNCLFTMENLALEFPYEICH